MVADNEDSLTMTQTKLRGSNDDEYQVYVTTAKSLGWEIKTYDEWLAS